MLMMWLAISVVSCKSSKSVQSDRTEHIQIQDSTYKFLENVSSEKADISRVGDIDENVVIEFTTYNAPDSTGKQSVKARGKIQKQRDEQHSEIILHNKDETTKEKAVKTSQQKSDSSEKVIQKEKKSSPYSCHLNIFLAILFFFILYKLVKWLR